MNITMCTVVKNRSYHYKETILQNIKDNRDAGTDFLLLDYNSDDDLEEWVKKNLLVYIEQGIFSYYKTIEPMCFNRSHSRNMAFKLATGDLICNIDADNFTGLGFSSYVKQKFIVRENIILCAGGNDNELLYADIGGRICVRNSDFLRVTGYDERMSGYGYEDYDFINRLQMSGLEKTLISDRKYLHAIFHTVIERIREENTFKNLLEVNLDFINPDQTRILFLFADKTFFLGMLVNSVTVDNKIRLRDNKLLDLVLLKKGHWEEEGLLTKNLFPEDGSIKMTIEYKPGESVLSIDLAGEGRIFYTLHDASLKEQTIISYSKSANHAVMTSNLANRIVAANIDFGQGTVYKNFDYKNPMRL
jgi:glycosyltransferase involved in cell wall biosynthesis